MYNALVIKVLFHCCINILGRLPVLRTGNTKWQLSLQRVSLYLLLVVRENVAVHNVGSGPAVVQQRRESSSVVGTGRRHDVDASSRKQLI